MHGDPRLSNAIYMPRSVRWIDFRTSAVLLDQSSVLAKRCDMEILVGSCCDKARLPVSVCSERLGECDGTTASAVLMFEALQRDLMELTHDPLGEMGEMKSTIYSTRKPEAMKRREEVNRTGTYYSTVEKKNVIKFCPLRLLRMYCTVFSKIFRLNVS